MHNTYTGFGEQVDGDFNALEIDIRVAEPASEPVADAVEPEVLITDDVPATAADIPDSGFN